MKRDAEELSPRQRLALPILAAEPTVDGAAAKIGVTRKTIYEWLKEEPFKQAVDEARTEFAKSGLQALCVSAKKAADTITKHLDCVDERVSLRAAEDIIEFVQKAIERDDLEKRIQSLEDRVK